MEGMLLPFFVYLQHNQLFMVLALRLGYMSLETKNTKTMETESKTILKHSRRLHVNWADKTILVADDVRINFLLLKALLGNTNAKIIWAEDGEKAIEYCKSNKDIDVVLMDYNMPKIDGATATVIIKKFRRDLPVISQTTYSLGSTEFKALSSTCDDYILKPIDKNQLISKIGKFIDNRVYDKAS